MQAKLNWLTDPAVFQINRLEAHSDHVCYVEGAPLRQSLDGQWRFVWSPRPALRPADFWREDYDLSAFGTWGAMSGSSIWSPASETGGSASVFKGRSRLFMSGSTAGLLAMPRTALRPPSLT